MTRQFKQVLKYRQYYPKDLAVVRIDGRDIYLGKYGSAESWEKFHRILSERAASARALDPTPCSTGVATAASDVTVVEVLLAFWNHAERHYRHADGTPSEEIGKIKAALRPARKLYSLTAARD